MSSRKLSLTIPASLDQKEPEVEVEYRYTKGQAPRHPISPSDDDGWPPEVYLLRVGGIRAALFAERLTAAIQAKVLDYESDRETSADDTAGDDEDHRRREEGR